MLIVVTFFGRIDTNVCLESDRITGLSRGGNAHRLGVSRVRVALTMANSLGAGQAQRSRSPRRPRNCSGKTPMPIRLER